MPADPNVVDQKMGEMESSLNQAVNDLLSTLIDSIRLQAQVESTRQSLQLQGAKLPGNIDVLKNSAQAIRNSATQIETTAQAARIYADEVNTELKKV